MIQITQSAIDQFKRLKIDHIRIIMKGRGCSGPVFELIEGRNEDGEHTVEVNDTFFSINQAHEQFFESMRIDFTEGMKEGFLISIQGGVTSGCGSCCGCVETDRLNQPIMPCKQE